MIGGKWNETSVSGEGSVEMNPKTNVGAGTCLNCPEVSGPVHTSGRPWIQ